jgi:hypothetical protein
MFSQQYIALYEELFKTAHESFRGRLEKTAAIVPSGMLGRMLGSAAVGGAAVGLPLYFIKNHMDQQARLRTRDRAFGAGLATGVNAPKIMQGVYDIAQNSPDAFLGRGAA